VFGVPAGRAARAGSVVKLRRKHRVSILWKSGKITRHRTVGLNVTTSRVDGAITNIESEWVSPRIVGFDITHVSAVIMGWVW
jgi:hypothetical protein